MRTARQPHRELGERTEFAVITKLYKLWPKNKPRETDWTPEEFATLECMWKDRQEVSVIAAAVGRTESGILSKVRRAKLKRNRQVQA